MNLVLCPPRRSVTAVILLALLLAGALGTAPAHAAPPQAVELGSACEGTQDAGFSDTEGTTFEFEIDCFASRGFTQGSGDGSTYEPFESNRRWQMATFIHRVLQSVDNRAQGAVQEAGDGDAAGFTTSESYFPDVDGNVHETNINGIASVGVVQGRTDGRYHPADPVNRGQMAAFIMRWVQVLEDGGFYEDGSDDGGDLLGVDVIDSNASGVLDVGDLVGLQFDGRLDELVGDGVDDVVRFADGDGSVVTLDCGNQRCMQDDVGLDGEPVLGDDGLLVIGVADDNLVEGSGGEVDGLDLDGEVTDVSDGFVTEDGGALDVAEDGVPLETLDLDALDAAAIEDILGLLDDLLGGGSLDGLLV